METSDDDSDGAASSPEPPRDAAGWRQLLSTLPARETLKTIQKDNKRAARLLGGFRPDPTLLRNGVVLTRLINEAMKEPAFAQELLQLPLAPVKDKPPSAPRVSPPAEPPSSPPSRSDEAIKAKLKEHRLTLREKDERIQALEAALAEAERRRDAAVAESAVATAARTAAEEEATRERHRRERESRRAERQPEPAAKTRAERADTATSSPVSPTRPALFEDTMERMLSRGRNAQVADICREALTLLEDAAARVAYGGRAEGVVRRLYAAALAAMPDSAQRQRSEEQERLALIAFLDAGDVAGAAESWARLAARRSAMGASATLKQNDAALLTRLAALTERTGQTEAVRAAFDRVRAAFPESRGLLRSLLAPGGKRFAPLLTALTPPGGAGNTVGPDEPIALPTLPGVTARRIVHAVDTGDAATIRKVRIGLRGLRERGEISLADALEAAVTVLRPVAAIPLLRPQEPRPIVVDASNVARHDPDPLALSPRPRVASLRELRDYLLRQGWFPVILIADANLRYHVDDRPGYLALVEAGIVRETTPGSIADTLLIREAEELRAPLVTNDRLTDWGEAARRIERYGFLLFPGGATLTPP